MVKTLRVAICIMLIVGVLAMSLSVFAYDIGDRVNSYEYLWCYYIWQFLHSIGIDVTYNDLVQYTDEVQDTIIDWVINYIADLIEADSQPSNYSIAQWIAPWQAEYDYWGNLQYNSTMLEDLQDFAQWLKNKLSLVDNDTVIVHPVYTVGGYTLYQFNTWYPCEYEDGTSYKGYQAIMLDQSNGPAPYGYFNWSIPDDRYPFGVMRGYCILMPSASAISYTRQGLNNDGSYSWDAGSSTQSNYWKLNNNGIYIPKTIGTVWSSDSTHGYMVIVGGHDLEADSYNALAQFANNATIVQSGNTKIVTANIVMPENNPDYTPGDGVTIIDGVPNYEVIQFDNITVENLPAIITQRTIPDIGNDEENPGFSVPWQAINGLIQYVAAPAGAIIALVNEAPVEGVIMLYALIGGMIIFGMIRIMREH